MTEKTNKNNITLSDNNEPGLAIDTALQGLGYNEASLGFNDEPSADEARQAELSLTL